MSKNIVDSKVELSAFCMDLMEKHKLSFDELMYLLSSELHSLNTINVKSKN